MKTREQIYGQEAAGILRDVSMYHALTEMQLLKLYPHKESKIRNLLSYLQKQDRMVLCGEYYRIPSEMEDSIDLGLSKAVWVLADFMEQVEYHSVSDYPAKIIFFADDEVYEIIYVEPGKEQLINQMLSTVKEVPPKYIILVEHPEQIAAARLTGNSPYNHYRSQLLQHFFRQSPIFFPPNQRYSDSILPRPQGFHSCSKDRFS